MKRLVILDTGPLVASINGSDRHHQWSVEQWKDIEPPFLTCESVLTEANYLLRSIPGGNKALLELLRRGCIRISFRLENHLEPVSLLLRKYANLPMSLADACLVRMAETISGSAILTLDRDFRVYRKSNRTVLPAIMPEA